MKFLLNLTNAIQRYRRNLCIAFFGSSVGVVMVVMAIYWGMHISDKHLQSTNITQIS